MNKVLQSMQSLWRSGAPLLAIASLCLLPFMVSPTASAVEKSGIAVQPGNLSLGRLNPGDTKQASYALTNIGDNEVTVKVYAEPYTVKGEEYERSYGSSSAYTKISDWVQVNQTEYHLAKNETVEVFFTVNIPKDVPAGGQYAMLINEIVQKQEDQTGTVGIVSSKRVGVALSAIINGETREEGKLLTQRTALFQPNSPLKGTLRIQNTGNIDFDVSAKMTVRSWIGGGLKYQLDNVSYNILPDTTRQINLEWQNASIGIYTVSLESSFLGKTAKTEHMVIVIPFWYVVTVAILIIIVVIYLVRKTGAKKDIKKNEEKKTRVKKPRS